MDISKLKVLECEPNKLELVVNKFHDKGQCNKFFQKGDVLVKILVTDFHKTRNGYYDIKSLLQDFKVCPEVSWTSWIEVMPPCIDLYVLNSDLQNILLTINNVEYLSSCIQETFVFEPTVYHDTDYRLEIKWVKDLCNALQNGYDGIRFLLSTGTYTGTFSLYGLIEA